MRTVKPSFTAGVVLVCANQRAPDADKPSCGDARGTELRAWLKDRIKHERLKGVVLSSRTTCLGVCSRHGVTVAIVPSGGEARMLVVDAENEREALWEQVRGCLVTKVLPELPAFLEDDEG